MNVERMKTEGKDVITSSIDENAHEKCALREKKANFCRLNNKCEETDLCTYTSLSENIESQSNGIVKRRHPRRKRDVDFCIIDR